MNKSALMLALTQLCAFGLLASAQAASQGDRLNSIVGSSGFKPSELSLAVGTAWDLNGDQPMSPASLSKLITAGAALHFLHPDFTFETTLASNASVQSRILRGPLYLVGGGDPSFTSEGMWVLVNEFKRNQIRVIEGDIIVDDSRFDGVRFTETRKAKRVDRAYDAPVGAMSFNWNSVNLYVRPGSSPGEPCQVIADPELTSKLIQVRNLTRTGSTANSIAIQRIGDDPNETEILTVTGMLPLGHKEVVVFKNILQPDLWSGENLVSFLKERGIQVKGKVRHGSAPANAHVLATFKSKPLSQIVADMAKFSNNFVAEMLIKNLAAEKGEKPATMATGITEAKAYLAQLGLGSAEFVNGSGFTEGNRISSKQLVQLLTAVRGDFTLAPEYVAALPIAGRDGTLKKRMKESPAEGLLRAKTGMLDGAIGLAGFAPTPFAFIYNGTGKEEAARALFDRLAIAIAQSAGP